MALGFIFAGIAVGCMIAGGVFWFAGRKAQEPAGWVRKDRIDITVQDIIRLAALSTTLDVHSLII